MNKSIEMALKRERRNRSFILKAVQTHDKPSENAPIIEAKTDEPVQDEPVQDEPVQDEPVQVEPEITVQPDESVQDGTPKKAKRHRRTPKNKANEDSDVSEV